MNIMRRIITRLIVTLAFVATVPCGGQEPPSSQFALDVMKRTLPIASQVTVLGLRLGWPLVLPECAYDPPGTMFNSSKRKQYRIVQSETCSADDEYTNLHGWPVRHVRFPTGQTSLAKNATVTTLEKDGVLLGIEFYTHGLQMQSQIFDQLKERFGEPSAVTEQEVGNLMGARFRSMTAIWARGSLDVLYSASAGRLDQGFVIISLPEGTEVRRSWKPARIPGERPL